MKVLAGTFPKIQVEIPYFRTICENIFWLYRHVLKCVDTSNAYLHNLVIDSGSPSRQKYFCRVSCTNFKHFHTCI